MMKEANYGKGDDLSVIWVFRNLMALSIILSGGNGTTSIAILSCDFIMLFLNVIFSSKIHSGNRKQTTYHTPCQFQNHYSFLKIL